MVCWSIKSTEPSSCRVAAILSCANVSTHRRPFAMSKIEKLTGKQVARFPEFIERWTEIGLCTDPANRPAAEEAVKLCYRCAGLKEPKRIVWCQSPLSQGL